MQDHRAINPMSTVQDAISVKVSERVGKFLMLLSELVLIAAMVYLFGIEQQRHLLPLLCLVIVGFCVHTWLPPPMRLPFFAFLSVSAIAFVLGTVNGLWVIAIGGGLIGICYLPVRFGVQLALLLSSAALLIYLRVYVPLPIWPVVGSMFMFRLFIFVYESRRSAVKPPLVSSISYLFLLTNTNFPLFPVIDYKTFRDVRYNDNEWAIYQRGIEWIVRGIVHLLLYRFIRAFVVPEYYELFRLTKIALFVAANYALYLQVSGQFHLITGVLHLFGFNLPRTHNCYFLASSFSDIWRRINIYWKDFMTKFIFFPTFFALRRRGHAVNPAMAFSVFVVFVCTWLLHSWQTFWLLGRFPVTLNDACLWLGAGLAVAINTLIDARRDRRAQPSRLFAAFSLSARTVGMFVMVSVFWACWTKPGFLSLVRGSLGRPGAVEDVLSLVIFLAIAIFAGTLVAFFFQPRDAATRAKAIFDFQSSAKLHLAVLTLAVTIASPQMGTLLYLELARSIANFKADPTTASAAGDRLQSYYEDLNTAAVQAGPLISSFSLDDANRRAQAEGFLKISRPADLYQGIDLIAGIETEIDGNSFSVNQYGMRDRKAITFDKPANTVRIAFVGSSVVMGYGVSNEEVFSRDFEACLNRERPDESRQIEVLNFGVGKQWSPHRLVRIQRKVMAFQPDVLFYFSHQDEFKELANHTAQLIAGYRKPLSSHLKDVADRAAIKSEMPPGEILTRLIHYEPQLLDAVYRTIVDECRSRSTVPVWIYLPIPDDMKSEPRDKLKAIATKAGFVVWDLSGWANGETGLFDNDYHPNAHGHHLITEALLRVMKSDPELLPGLGNHTAAARQEDNFP